MFSKLKAASGFIDIKNNISDLSAILGYNLPRKWPWVLHWEYYCFLITITSYLF